MSPLSQLSALTAYYVQAVEEIRRAEPLAAAALSEWADREKSRLKSLAVCCKHPLLFKGIYSASGPCRPLLVLLVISPGVSADGGPGDIL